jgi:hypothetical protein
LQPTPHGLASEAERVLDALYRRLDRHAPYLGALAAVRLGSNALHLAVMREPYLTYVVDGRKTIESRFSINRVPPYDCVTRGDVLLLKGLGSPVKAVAIIDEVYQYRLDESTWSTIHGLHAREICASADFYRARAAASYATLMHIEHVCEIEPVTVKKRDRRGWMVVLGRDAQLALM